MELICVVPFIRFFSAKRATDNVPGDGSASACILPNTKQIRMKCWHGTASLFYFFQQYR